MVIATVPRAGSGAVGGLWSGKYWFEYVFWVTQGAAEFAYLTYVRVHTVEKVFFGGGEPVFRRFKLFLLVRLQSFARIFKLILPFSLSLYPKRKFFSNPIKMFFAHSPKSSFMLGNICFPFSLLHEG